jgi:hypothetical protein
MLLAEMKNSNLKPEREATKLCEFDGSELTALSATCSRSFQALHNLAEFGLAQQASFEEAVAQFKASRQEQEQHNLRNDEAVAALQHAVQEMNPSRAKMSRTMRSLSVGG